MVCLQSASTVSTQKDISTGAMTRISKLRNKEAKSTKTVGRHNTETREMKSMVRKYQKFQNFLEDKTHKASTKSTMDNCNYNELLKEISPGEVPN